MKKLAVLSLVLLLVVGLFVTGCRMNESTSDVNKKPEVKAPAEKNPETSTEKK